MCTSVYLTTDDLKKLKLIGYGTDGCVYEYKDNLLIKIYHQDLSDIYNNCINEDDDIKIYSKDTCVSSAKKIYTSGIRYIISEDNGNHVKLSPSDALEQVINKGEHLKYTDLPVGAVYLNGHLVGDLLVKQKGIQIHKLTGMPKKVKQKIYLKVLRNYLELINNNIYHIDLANSPYADRYEILPDGIVVKKGHSHILVNPFTLEPHFIDLDGKSTVYTDKDNENYYAQSLTNLNILTLEFLLGIDYQEDESFFNSKDIPDNMIEKLHDSQASYEDIENLALSLTK